MSSGDAYIYCVIVTDEVAVKTKLILQEIENKEKQVKVILKEFKNPNRLPNPERGSEGLKLLDDQDNLLQKIVSLCRKPIAIFHVTSDDCGTTYNICSRFNYEPVKLSELIHLTKGRLWINEKDIEKYRDAMCVCLPSHHDVDDEFLESLGVTTKRLEDYNEHRHTEPINKTCYALVDLDNGIVQNFGTLTMIATEWGECWYKMGERHYDVRKVCLKEIDVVDKEILDQTLEKMYDDTFCT